MNERIRELADKIWEEKYWTNSNTDRLLPAQLNRFAELIVRECIDNVAVWEKDSRNHISYMLKRHFGVEL